MPVTPITPITAAIPPFTVTPVINTPTFPEDIDQYNTELPAVIAAQTTLTAQLNTFITQVGNLEANVIALEASTLSASDIALASANFKGTWLVGTAYTVPSSVWLNGRFYAAIEPSTGQTPPNATYWALIPGIDDTAPSLESTYSGTKIQDLHDSQTTAIANLASASGSIANTSTPVFTPISTTPTDLPFTVVTPSTNSAVFSFDDTLNTMSFFKNGVFNYSSPVTFGASTSDARVVTFDLLDTAVVTAGSFEVGKTYRIVSIGTTDFTLIGAASNTVGLDFTATDVGTGTGTAYLILGSQEYNVDIAAGTTTTIPANTLLTVGSNGIPSAPITIKVQARVDAGATVDLISFTSTLITNSIVNEGALAETIHAAPVKAIPADADEFTFLDSVGGLWTLAKMTGTNLKAWLKTYFDTFYLHPSGRIIQSQTFQTGTPATGTTLIPFDNTIPQSTEGTQFLALAFTPTIIGSTLNISIQINLSHSAIGYTSAALYDGLTANAIASVSQYQTTSSMPQNLIIQRSYTTSSLAPISFTVRGGGSASGTTTLNGTNGAGIFSGAFISSIKIDEVAP